MATNFNPYHEWLGIDPRIIRPNYYQLLGIDEQDAPHDVIAIAADRAQTRVRSFRPGSHAAAWAQLLDELASAKRCLLDSAARAQYDARLASGLPEVDVHPQPTVSYSPVAGYDPPGSSPASATSAPSTSAASTSAPASPLPAATPPAYAASPATYPHPTPAPSLGPMDPMSPMSPAGYSNLGPAANLPPSSLPNAGFPNPMLPQPMASHMASPNPMLPVANSLPTGPTGPIAPMPGPGTYGPGAIPQSAYAQPGHAHPMASPLASPMANPMAPLGAPHPTAFPNPMQPMPSHPGAHPAMAPGMPSAPGYAPGGGYGGVGYGGGYPSYPSASGPLATPAGMMPAPGAIPMAMPVNASPYSLNPSPYAPLATPTAPASYGYPEPQAEPQPAVRTSAGSSSTRVMVAERARQQSHLPLVFALAALLLVGTFGILWIELGNKPGDSQADKDKKDQVATRRESPKVPAAIHAPPKSTPPRDANPRGKAPLTTVAITDKPADDTARSSREPTTPANTMASPKPADQPSSLANAGDPPAAEMKPEAKPSETPDAKPETAPTPDAPTNPEPTPAPEPKPDPKPEPAPKPEPSAPPANSTPATKAEIAQLSKALVTARAALGDFHPEAAKQELAKVESLNMLPEHAQKFRRLRELAHNVAEFRSAMDEAVKGFQGGQVIMVGSTAVGIVETFPGQDRIILRVAGRNNTYRFSDMPVGLAAAIADQWLAKDKASTKIIKASFVAMHRNSTEDMLNKARQWLEEARGELPEPAQTVSQAMLDSYELQ